MRHSYPQPWWAPLLAMRLAAGPRIHQLARWLHSHPNPEYVEPEPPWCPTVGQKRLASLQVEALATLGLDLVPVWQLADRLRCLNPLPVALFVRGDTRLLYTAQAVGVVGSRRASPNAAHWAYELAYTLAAAKTVVVSGGAQGIDTAAHRGAVAGQGRTLVFMGSAIDRPYPSCNRNLFVEIIGHGGALVSEHPPLSTTYKSAHALRNRFIAAQANALIVAEAAHQSGTLVTIRWARRLKKPVYISPHHIGQQRGGLQVAVQAGWASVYNEAAKP